MIKFASQMKKWLQILLNSENYDEVDHSM